MITTSSMRVELDGALAVLSLTQAARGNPFDGEFTRDFLAVVSALWNAHETGTVRAVLLRADGANFSYGGDLKSFVPLLDQLGPLVREWTSQLHMGLQRLWELPVPVVCAAQGFVMGGGVSLMAGCDVVVACEAARFGSAFAQLGFSNDSGSSVTLSVRMGVARARRYVLLAEVLNAADALQAGLVDRVVPAADLQAEALKLAQQLADGPTLAYGQIKRLFGRAAGAHLAAQLEDEALTLARVAGSADAKEGIIAMAERRKPVFRGR